MLLLCVKAVNSSTGRTPNERSLKEGLNNRDASLLTPSPLGTKKLKGLEQADSQTVKRLLDEVRGDSPFPYRSQ